MTVGLRRAEGASVRAWFGAATQGQSLGLQSAVVSAGSCARDNLLVGPYRLPRNQARTTENKQQRSGDGLFVRLFLNLWVGKQVE
jgi:hypothetical protein